MYILNNCYFVVPPEVYTGEESLGSIDLGILFVLKLLTYTCNFPPCRSGGSRGHDRMVVGFTTACAIGAYHH